MQNPIKRFKAWRKKRKEVYEARVVSTFQDYDFDKDGQILNSFTGFTFWHAVVGTIILYGLFARLVYSIWPYL